MDTANLPLGTKVIGICDLCGEGRPRKLIVTDSGAVCGSCFREMRRDGAFDNMTSFEHEALGLAPNYEGVPE